MNKKIASLFLIFSLIFSAAQASALSPISLAEIDPDYKVEIYNASEGEEIKGSLIVYPQLGVLVNKEGSSYIYFSDNYGKTVDFVNLTEEYNGFKANGIIWDKTIYPGYMVYGTANGKIAMYHSVNFKNWVPIYWDKEIDGTIMNVSITDYGCDIYYTDGHRNYKLNTKALAGKIEDEPIEFLGKLPTLFAGYGNFGFYSDGDNVYETIDGENFTKVNLENVKRVFDMRIQKTVCADALLQIGYINDKGKIAQKGVPLDMDYGLVLDVVDVPKETLINYEAIGTDINFSGSWGYPMLVSDSKVAYLAYLKKDSRPLSCDRRNTSWLAQHSSPDTWAYMDIEKLAEDSVLTPRTTPEDYRAPVTRQLFAEYIYNLISNEVNFLTDTKYFEDTDDEYVNSLAGIDVIKGTDGKFNPNDKITREQAAAILARILRYFSIGPARDNIADINDKERVSVWARNDVEFLYGHGIFKGDNNRNFNPQANMSVQEALVTIRRIEKLLNVNSYCELCG